MTEKKYSFARERCGSCGTILVKKRAAAAPGMRGDIPHGKCPECGKLLPLVKVNKPQLEEPEPEVVEEKVA